MGESALPIQCLLIGTGNRGAEAYGQYALAHPRLFRFVAAADPNEARRLAFSKRHGIDQRKSVDSWEKLLEFAGPDNLVFICGPDRSHYEQLLAFMRIGCPMVVEKPAVVEPRFCADLSRLAAEQGSRIILCHVLRYTPFFVTLKRLLDSGRIGKVISLNLQENIAWYHFAHSYVRGNWRNSALASPAILAKSVHDLDILYYLAGAPAGSIASMGRLNWFKAENAPAGAPDRCLSNCPHAVRCPWFAPDLYLTDHTGWPTSTISDDPGLSARIRALEDGPYGRCVYRCDNDVVDNQDVLIQFKNDVSASFSMRALTYEKTRSIQIAGSEGEITGDLDTGKLRVRGFLRGDEELIHLGPTAGGHNGGDAGLMGHIARVFAQTSDTAEKTPSIESSLEGHWMAFAAEESRKTRMFVDLDAYRIAISSTRETVSI